jgi:SAM-dependent methyltransferase
MADAYQDDLAYIHDAGYGGPARNAAPVLLSRLRLSNIGRGLVIDLGCGSGILSEVVTAAGFDVLGIDLSPAMVELARQRVPGGEFRVGSLLSAELPACVAVAAVGECVNYLFDRGITEQRLRRLFRRVHDALCPGGVFVFDAAGPGRVPGSGTFRTYREEDGWAVLVAAEEDRERLLLTRRITSFRKVGDLYRRDHEVHRLRLLPRALIVGLLRKVGFRVRTLSCYGPLKLPPGWVGFLARKP